MLKTFKTVLYTLMACVIFTFASALWWKYDQSKVAAQEMEVQEIVDTLTEITNWTKPDFEHQQMDDLSFFLE